MYLLLSLGWLLNIKHDFHPQFLISIKLLLLGMMPLLLMWVLLLLNLLEMLGSIDSLWNLLPCLQLLLLKLLNSILDLLIMVVNLFLLVNDVKHLNAILFLLSLNVKIVVGWGLHEGEAFFWGLVALLHFGEHYLVITWRWVVLLSRAFRRVRIKLEYFFLFNIYLKCHFICLLIIRIVV